MTRVFRALGPLARLFLVLCVGWQALAAAGAGVVLANPQDRAHAFLHFEAAAHHHDDHGDAGNGLHQDDSVASVKHVLADGSQFSLALVTLPSNLLSLDALAHPEMREPPGWPLPFLGGLERPPKRAA